MSSSRRGRWSRAWGFGLPAPPAYNEPTRRSEALAIISRHEAELHALGVQRLSLFGSVARDDATPASDVDVLVEFDRPVGYFHLFDVQDRLSRSSAARSISSRQEVSGRS